MYDSLIIESGIRVFGASTINKFGNIVGGRKFKSGRYVSETVTTLACGVDTTGRLQMFIVPAASGASVSRIDRGSPPDWDQLDLLLDPQPRPGEPECDRLWSRRSKLCNRAITACRHAAKRSLGPEEWNRWAAWWAGTEAEEEEPSSGDTSRFYSIEQGVSVWRASTRDFRLNLEPIRGGRRTDANTLDPVTISTLYWGIDTKGEVRLFIQTPNGPRLLDRTQRPQWNLFDLLLDTQPEGAPEPGSYDERFLWLRRNLLCQRLNALCDARAATVLDGADKWRKWELWFSHLQFASLELSRYRPPKKSNSTET